MRSKETQVGFYWATGMKFQFFVTVIAHFVLGNGNRFSGNIWEAKVARTPQTSRHRKSAHVIDVHKEEG